MVLFLIIVKKKTTTTTTTKKNNVSCITSSNSSVIFRMISEFCMFLNISPLTAPTWGNTQWQQSLPQYFAFRQHTDRHYLRHLPLQPEHWMKKLIRSKRATSRSCLYASIQSSTTAWKINKISLQWEETAEQNIITWPQLCVPTCVALFPALTTSNRVIFSIPFSWWWPFTRPTPGPLPAPTPLALSPSAFFPFLAASWGERWSMKYEIKRFS